MCSESTARRRTRPEPIRRPAPGHSGPRPRTSLSRRLGPPPPPSRRSRRSRPCRRPGPCRPPRPCRRPRLFRRPWPCRRPRRRVPLDVGRGRGRAGRLLATLRTTVEIGGLTGLVLVPEGEVDPDEGLLLVLGQVGVGQDLPTDVGLTGARFEDPGLDVEGLGRDPQALGDLLEDLRRGPAEAPFDLGEVGIGDPGQLREPAEGEPGRGALFADEGTEVPEALG